MIIRNFKIREKRKNELFLAQKEKQQIRELSEMKMNFFMNEDTTGYETVLDTNLEEEKPSLLHPIGLAMGTYLFATDEKFVFT